MGILAWTMMGLALWHFTVFLPDRFWGGIIGAFLGAIIGANISGFILEGFTIPNDEQIHLLTALDAVPGTIVGLLVIYLIGLKKPLET